MKATQQKVIVQRAVAEGITKQAESIRIQTVQQVYAAMLITLHDKWDWKPEQLVQIFEQITYQFDCIADKYVKIEDFYKLLDELGIKVVEG